MALAGGCPDAAKAAALTALGHLLTGNSPSWHCWPMNVCAGRLTCVSDGTTPELEPPGGPDMVSLTAHWYKKAREQAARTGASPSLPLTSPNWEN